MKLDSLDALYLQSLKDLYSAEKQLLQALPKMVKKVVDPKLKQALQEHQTQTEEQVKRLDQISDMLGKKLTGHKCAAMEGIIEEGKELLEMEGQPEVIDAGIIGAAQRVEHYEMAGYGCSRTYARMLGLNEQADLLQLTLEEEAQADELLTEIAETIVNRKAAQASA